MATMRNSAFGSRHVYPGFGRSLVLRSGFLCPVCGLGEGTDLFSACPYVRCTQISAGWRHTVLLRNDGTAVACGENGVRQCDIPTLADGMSYTQA